MDLINRDKAQDAVFSKEDIMGYMDEVEDGDINRTIRSAIRLIERVPSAFEGMTNNEVHKAIFGFELDPRYLVTDDTCIVSDEDCPVCPLYNKTCNNRNFAEWLDSPYKGVSE